MSVAGRTHRRDGRTISSRNGRDRKLSGSIVMVDSFVIDATGPVVRIHLNRPESGNAFTPEMMHSFAGFLREHGESAETRLIALTAEGKMFSMGRDPHTPKPEKEPTAYELRKTVLAGGLGP